jgi:hypothetical protein
MYEQNVRIMKQEIDGYHTFLPLLSSNERYPPITCMLCMYDYHCVIKLDGKEGGYGCQNQRECRKDQNEQTITISRLQCY